jgi:hypothetical protein
LPRLALAQITSAPASVEAIAATVFDGQVDAEVRRDAQDVLAIVAICIARQVGKVLR